MGTYATSTWPFLLCFHPQGSKSQPGGLEPQILFDTLRQWVLWLKCHETAPEETGEEEPGMGNGKGLSTASLFLSWITDLVSFSTTHPLPGARLPKMKT